LAQGINLSQGFSSFHLAQVLSLSRHRSRILRIIMSLFYGVCTRKGGAWLLLDSFNTEPAFDDNSVHFLTLFMLNKSNSLLSSRGWICTTDFLVMLTTMAFATARFVVWTIPSP